MPHYRFNDAQVATLSEFLLAKTDSDLLGNVHLEPPTPQQIAHGKRLVSDYGCASCHEIAGIKKPEELRPGAQPHRQQADHAAYFPARDAAHPARLHRRPRSSSRAHLHRPEDAAVHLHADADRSP